jgi:hypothetical protein
MGRELYRKWLYAWVGFNVAAIVLYVLGSEVRGRPAGSA